MSRFISPSLDQIDNLRTPLTPGERIVLELFNDHLSPQWEIYIQPHLNGLRPDFVLVNPNAGIAVFEVKDWDLDAMEYFVRNRPESGPELMGRKDGKTFSQQHQNPIEKVFHYKQEIHDLYCPRLDKKAGFAVLTAGVIFPFAKESRLRDLFAPCIKHKGMDKYPDYYPLSGADALATSDIETVFPESRRVYSKFMKPELAKDLRNWLIEPNFSEAQRRPLILDKNQRDLATSRTESGLRRIRGPAGSGKSLVLAARAAELVAQNKKVLVVTYNITLVHYLMDIAVRWPNRRGNTRKNVTWLNFHYWCKRICLESDCYAEYKNLWHGDTEREDSGKRSVLDKELPALVIKILQSSRAEFVSKYDAILVDEGQDYLPLWWQALRLALQPGGEMLLVADATQDIYDTAKSWTDEAMTNAGFSGRWSELKTSYRLPPLALKYARDFARQYLPPEFTSLPESPQGELEGVDPCKLRWVHTTSEHAPEVCRSEIFRIAPAADPKLLAIADVVFLSSSQKFGWDVVGLVGAKGVRAIHTFAEDDRQSRRRKLGFYMGDSRIKATTLHSFKGWESTALVIYIGEAVDQRSLALIYTGLTRIKRQSKGSFLTIVSCAEELMNYGKSWPEFYSASP